MNLNPPSSTKKKTHRERERDRKKITQELAPLKYNLWSIPKQKEKKLKK